MQTTKTLFKQTQTPEAPRTARLYRRRHTAQYNAAAWGMALCLPLADSRLPSPTNELPLVAHRRKAGRASASVCPRPASAPPWGMTTAAALSCPRRTSSPQSPLFAALRPGAAHATHPAAEPLRKQPSLCHSPSDTPLPGPLRSSLHCATPNRWSAEDLSRHLTRGALAPALRRCCTCSHSFCELPRPTHISSTQQAGRPARLVHLAAAGHHHAVYRQLLLKPSAFSLFPHR